VSFIHSRLNSLGLTLQILPLVARVRWHLWRTPFAQLKPYWSARVQSALDANFCAHKQWAEGETPDRATIDEVWNCAHAVSHAARLVPFASCLTQAMTLQLVLAERGYESAICIGVGKKNLAPSQDGAPTHQESATRAELGDLSALNSPAKTASVPKSGAFRAHAWVEWRGKVLVGGDISAWKPLTILAPVAPAPRDSNPISSPVSSAV
jgi:hypothetical protein